MSRALLAKLLLGLVGLVLLASLAARTADPAKEAPTGHQHGGNERAAAPEKDIGWPLLAGPAGVTTTFALATGVFWMVSRRRAAAARTSRRRVTPTEAAAERSEVGT